MISNTQTVVEGQISIPVEQQISLTVSWVQLSHSNCLAFVLMGEHLLSNPGIDVNIKNRVSC